MAAPQVVSAVVLIPDLTLKVAFDQLMLHDAELVKPTNYVLAGPTLTGVPTNVEATDNAATFVVLTLAREMRTTIGADYIVTVSNVRNPAEEEVDPANNSATFVGVGVPPKLLKYALPVDNTHVRIEFDEVVNDIYALDDGNYVIVDEDTNPVAVTDVEKVSTKIYKLTTGVQVVGKEHTVTASNILDIAGNVIEAPNDNSIFSAIGGIQPVIEMLPVSGSEEIETRAWLRITARDTRSSPTGLDASKWWTRLRFMESGTERVIYAIKDGIGQPGFSVANGSVFPLGTLEVTQRIRPINGTWLPDTKYYVETYMETLPQGFPSIPSEANAIVGTFETDAHSCFEDILPSITSLEEALLLPLSDYPAVEQIRRLLLNTCTSSTEEQVRARTLIHLALVTELRTLLAENVDFSLANVCLCDRVGVLSIMETLQPYMMTLERAVNQVPKLTNETKDLLLQYIRSDSPVYVVGVAAVVVLLAAILGE